MNDTKASGSQVPPEVAQQLAQLKQIKTILKPAQTDPSVEAAFQRLQGKILAPDPLREIKKAIVRIMAIPLTQELDNAILDKYKADFYVLECLYALFDELNQVTEA